MSETNTVITSSEMLKPLRNLIVVKQHEAESESSGGIVLVHSAQEQQNTGIVVSAGEGFYDNKGNFVPTQVKKGDVVLFALNAVKNALTRGMTVTIEDEVHILLPEQEILAVVKPV